ncbi:MAG: aminobenzoyl-glutamate transporter [Marinilabiliales bacterium]|nr:MAG: aminobenzoyl-glutamate transporter [Marinilabiliales bacterium]
MKKKRKISLLGGFLNSVEKVVNALPHPALLFGIFAVTVLILSAIFSSMGVSVAHPGTGEEIRVVNLFEKEHLHEIITKMVSNFTDFAPLGIVIVAMLGIGLAERSGLINALIRKLVLAAPAKLLTFVLVFAGIMSNMASSVGYVLLVPLGAVIFIAAKRHPIVGMAAAFAGVSGGYSANLILGTIDPLLAGLSTEAAQIIYPTYVVNPTANYYFMIVSTFIIAIAGTWVTEKIVAPRFGEYKGEIDEDDKKIEKLTKDEKKGMRWALYVSLVFGGILLAGLIPADGILRGEEGSLLKSPVLKGVVEILFVWAALCGIVYGIATKKFKNDSDVMNAMADSAKSLGAYIVLVFFAAQFVAYFNWSNLGLVIAVEGANGIMSLNLGLIPLMILFVLLSGLINLVMGSASAKWALLAPIFIPMFMLLGYSPELTQVCYRIGDSVTNIISPMMSFFALIIAFIQKYDKKAGIGTVVATMMPYSFVFFIVWTLMLVLWLWIGLPLGPAGPLTYPA